MIDKLFKAPSRTLSTEVFRYVLAGTLAYVIDYSILIILTNVFRVYYLASAAAAFAIGAVVSYILNITWVFDERAISDRRIEALLFFSIGVVGLFLNHYCIMFFTETAKLHYLISKFISTLIVFAVNFTARKYILFR